MATLQKIRNRGTLLLIVVGLALLTFIVGDFIGSGNTFFQQGANNVAKINGDKIQAQDYMIMLDNMQEAIQIDNGTTTLPEETVSQIRESLWETTVRAHVFGTEAEEIGMQVTKDELLNLMTGDNVSPIISTRRVFFNEQGVFDVNIVKNFVNMIYSDEESQIPMEEKLKYRKYWEFWEHYTRENRIEEKYTNLISSALVVTPLEAKYSFEGKKDKYDAVYAMKNYFAIADSTITVSDAEVKELYNKKKETFKQEKDANIKYVTYDIKPSEEDFAKVEKMIEGLKPEFATTADISSVTNANSDMPYAAYNLSKEDVEEVYGDFAQFAFSAKKDSVMGPIFVEDTYKMARLVETGVTLPDSVKLRNIVVFREGADREDSKEKTQELADSLMRELNKGADFVQLAAKYSMGQNAQTGGEIGWVREPGLQKSITEKAFTAKANTYFQTEEGGAIMIFNVQELGVKVPKVKLAVVSINVTASSKTRAAIYGMAKKFASEANNNIIKFAENAKEQNVQVSDAANVNPNANTINNITHSREVIRWAFNEDVEVNAVSDVFECDDKLVVAALENRNEKGYKTLEQVKDILTAEVRKDKKAEQMIAEMGSKTMEQLQAEGFNLDTVKGVNFASTYAGSIGNEPAMFGTVAMKAMNELSAPIKVNMGAYVYKVVNKVEGTATYDETQEINMMTDRQRYLIMNFVYETLKDAAEIEDYRYKFF